MPGFGKKELKKLRGNAGDHGPVFRSRKHGAALKSVAVLRIVRQAARAGIDLAVSPPAAHASHARDRAPRFTRFRLRSVTPIYKYGPLLLRRTQRKLVPWLCDVNEVDGAAWLNSSKVERLNY